MESIKILQADILDIIFEGRNKLYGAYDLRKTYNKRLATALFITASFCSFMLLSYFLVNAFNNGDSKLTTTAKEFVLPTAKIEDKKEPTPNIPPRVKPTQIAMVRSSTPRIEKDENVKENEKPPDINQLDSSRIGNITQSGDKDDFIHPPTDNSNGVVETPKKPEEDWDNTFRKVEIESEYPGGPEAWRHYLIKNLQYPSEASENGIQGSVIVQFIVDKEGNISNVEAISGPEQLYDEAVRVIRKSGKWTPAIQNGRQVKSYKKQPITFQLDQ